MSAKRGPAFLGRTRERELLDGLLARARAGQSAVVVVHGEAGIGKTALLDYAARQASGFRVARIAGVQAEMELPFAGLHQLCGPVLDRLAAIPAPQRTALNVALGVSPGATPDRFLVGLAVLSLLSAVAEERPLLCLVDDAQWLDAASGQVLAFVARRLLAEPVAIAFACRDPLAGHALSGLTDLALGGLPEADAWTLLSRAVPGRLDDRVRDRIIAETGGNPLALLELAQSMSSAERAGGYVLPGAAGVASQVEEQYLGRVRALPEATQRLILLAAADPVGDAALLWRAAERLSLDATALDPATAAGLLEIDDRVRFHHPLVRSAVYRASPPDARRSVHDALAAVSDPARDADRHAWHRALATAEPDDAVATELEEAAERARTRGGVAAASAFLERATTLTADPATRARRALAAAEASFHAGAFDATLALTARADAGSLEDLQRAQTDLLRGQVAFATGRLSDAAPRLLQAATRLETFDQDLARQTYMTAWGVAFVAAQQHSDRGVLLDLCRAVQALAPRPDGPRPLDLLLDGLALLATDGHAAAAPTLHEAADALLDISLEDVLRFGWVAVAASVIVWDHEAFGTIVERQIQLVRDAGALAQLPLFLSQACKARTWIGDFTGAESLLAEATAVAAATGSRFAPYAALHVRAPQGREADAGAVIATALDQAAAGDPGAASHAHWASAVLNNGLGRYPDAMAAAQQAAANAFGDPFFSMWALPELVEAATRVGDRELASDAIERLARTTQPAGTDFALGIEARSRALVTDGSAAAELYLEAIERLGRARLRPDLARTHLLFGEWLRGQDRSADAREHLQMAYTMLEAIGMEAFAERARAELAAAGGSAPKRTAEPSGALTPQEEQIARLARDGLTNSEIGGQLFLSPRTVEWHLRKVFAKLAITSRNGLATALPAVEQD